MEKLQPLITHRFWVLFGLALLVPLVSWFLYNGSMQEQIQGREDTLKSEFSKAGQGAKAPNQSWIAGAKKLNELHRAAYDRSAQKLWLDQQNGDSIFWPKRMLPYVKNLSFGQKFEGSDTGGLTIYKTEYDRQHEKQVLTQINTYRDGKGLCEVNTSAIHRVPAGTWNGLPTWTQVWDAQEDEWLVAQLLRSIDKVNTEAAARSITEAPVRQLHELRLYGGNLDGKKKSSKGGGAAGGMSNYANMMSGGREANMMGGGGGGAGTVGGENSSSNGGGMGGMGGSAKAKVTISSPSLDFDVIEEFGSPENTSQKKKAPGSNSSFATGSQSSAPQRRYVHNKEDGKYRTRGFKTRLTIEQDKLPEVLAQLTNSAWPVEIVRVHWEAANESGRSASSVSGAGGGGLGGMGGGFGGSPGDGAGRAASMGGGGGFGGFGGGGSGAGSIGDEDSSSSGGFGGASSRTKKSDPGEVDPLEAALRDPTLATVVVAGLITIFRASDDEAAKMQEMLKEKAASEDMKAAGAMKDGAMKDGAMKDGAMKDGAMKDGAMKDDKPMSEKAK